MVLFNYKEDFADKKITIAGMIEVKNVLSSLNLTTGLCTEEANESVDIVALLNKENTEF